MLTLFDECWSNMQLLFIFQQRLRIFLREILKDCVKFISIHAIALFCQNMSEFIKCSRFNQNALILQTFEGYIHSVKYVGNCDNRWFNPHGGGCLISAILLSSLFSSINFFLACCEVGVSDKVIPYERKFSHGSLAVDDSVRRSSITDKVTSISCCIFSARCVG